MKPNRTHSSRSRGFSLVEIMVGVAIGMIGMLVIFRTIQTWENHTRATTSGGDAQTTGNLAMFSIERDLKQAGLGFMGIGPAVPAALGCTVSANDNGRLFSFSLAPVQIVPGAGGGSDTVNVLYGDSAFFVTEEKFTGSTDTSKTTVRRNGFKPGDLAIAAGGGNCAMLQITGDSNPDGKTLDHNNGGYLDFYYGAAASAVARFNPAGGPGVAFALGTMYSLGPRPKYVQWQVNAASGVLTSSESFSGAPAADVAEGVVSIKAQYGLDLDNDGIVETWQTASPVTPAIWGQLRAIRVGLLVRSRQFERTADTSEAGIRAVTQTAPSWKGGTFVMTNVGGGSDTYGLLDANPLNWRYYRYRVYEKEIPLRNVVWGTSPGSTAILGG